MSDLVWNHRFGVENGNEGIRNLHVQIVWDWLILDFNFNMSFIIIEEQVNDLGIILISEE